MVSEQVRYTRCDHMPAHIQHGARRDPHQRQTRTHSIHGVLTASSLKSLAHSSSISSTDRRLARPTPGEVSPPLSATHWMSLLLSSPSRTWRAGPSASSGCTADHAKRDGYNDDDAEQRHDAYERRIRSLVRWCASHIPHGRVDVRNRIYCRHLRPRGVGAGPAPVTYGFCRSALRGVRMRATRDVLCFLGPHLVSHAVLLLLGY